MSKQVGRKPSSYITDAIIVIIMLALMFITVYPAVYSVCVVQRCKAATGPPMWWPLEPFTLCAAMSLRSRTQSWCQYL